MNITLTPAQSQYLEEVAAGLADLPDEEREEVLLDLLAHFAELSDEEIVPVLGAPTAFVAEFRASAGLDQPGRLSGLIGAGRARLERWSNGLIHRTQWPRWRHLWVWTRGWLVLSVFAAVSQGVAFHSFPIPAIGGSTAFGAVLVVGATWLSLWLDGQPNRPLRNTASVVFSVLGVWALVFGLFGGNPLGYPAAFVDFDEPYLSDHPLTGQNGLPVENIYAFDVEGNPVEVLLFDQEGRPLLTMPPWVYEEAEMSPWRDEMEYPNGHVSFSRDEVGRIIPNLYPLDLQIYNEWGELVPVDPPGSWSAPDGPDEDGSDEDLSSPHTTVSAPERD